MGVIKKIWDLKGDLDKALVSRNYYKLYELREQYTESLQDGTDIRKAFLPTNKKYWTMLEQLGDAVKNQTEISNHIWSILNKFFSEEDVEDDIPAEWSTDAVPAHEIWTIRDLFDNSVVLASTDGFRKDDVIAAGKSVLERLNLMANNCKDIFEDGKEEILNIAGDVKDYYHSKFQDVEAFQDPDDI